MSEAESDHTFRDAVRGVASEAGLEMAVSVHDYETGADFSVEGDRWFHAASTMKVAVLWALMDEVAAGRLRLDDPLHVRNRFISLVDGGVFRVDTSRDADSIVHSQLGKTLPLEKLAHAMITRSSNLATNLLVDFLTPERIVASLAEAKVSGIEICRGVEDDAAFQAGFNNRVTADGLKLLFRAFGEDGPLPEELRETALGILHEQEFNRMIPAGLPDEARVAHKTGDISTVCHDAGIVTLPDRAPYVVAILSEGGGEWMGGRQRWRAFRSWSSSASVEEQRNERVSRSGCLRIAGGRARGAASW